MSKPLHGLTKEALQRCADCGMTKSQAARDLGASLNTLCGAAARHNIAFVNHFELADRAAKYRHCAEAGMTRAETARHLGVAKRSVDGAAHRYKIKFTTASDRIRLAWQACADAGMTLSEAAEARGTTKSSAIDAKRRYGIKFKSEAPLSRVLRMQKAAKSVQWAMRMFWHSARDCPVPLTFEEFCAGLDGVDRTKASSIIGGFVHDGLLKATPVAGHSIYAPTDTGAEVARELKLASLQERRAA